MNNNLKIYQVLPEMYPRLVQYANGIYYDGNGNPLGHSAVPGLQAVTNAGNTTNNNIIITDAANINTTTIGPGSINLLSDSGINGLQLQTSFDDSVNNVYLYGSGNISTTLTPDNLTFYDGTANVTAISAGTLLVNSDDGETAISIGVSADGVSRGIKISDRTLFGGSMLVTGTFSNNNTQYIQDITGTIALVETSKILMKTGYINIGISGTQSIGFATASSDASYFIITNINYMTTTAHIGDTVTIAIYSNNYLVSGPISASTTYTAPPSFPWVNTFELTPTGFFAVPVDSYIYLDVITPSTHGWVIKMIIEGYYI